MIKYNKENTDIIVYVHVDNLHYGAGKIKYFSKYFNTLNIL